MRPHLMFRDRDFDLPSGFAPHANPPFHDLQLNAILAAMSKGDDYLYRVAARGMLSGLDCAEEILYRQHVLSDCTAHPEIIRELYAIAREATTHEKRYSVPVFNGSLGVLDRAIEALETYARLLARLQTIVEDHPVEFRSEGFERFFAMVKTYLDDDYLSGINEQLRLLRFKDGIPIRMELGQGNQGVHYVLQTPTGKTHRRSPRLGLRDKSALAFEVHPRDDKGRQALIELTDRALKLVSNTVAQSSDLILSFFTLLAAEAGFYVACLNLHDRLVELDLSTCAPIPVAWKPPALSFGGIYDVSLALQNEGKVVANDANADGRSLMVITGANSGGKSTLLRAIGLAHLMMRCGMDVAAESFRASIGHGLFTHFIREEDTTIGSGKLDEELTRMGEIADQLRPRSLVLFNESFAATNEREGSEIAHAIVTTLVENDIKVIFVTHLYEFAHRVLQDHAIPTLFLRAANDSSGLPDFIISEGEPLPTSYGKDLYERVFAVSSTRRQ